MTRTESTTRALRRSGAQAEHQWRTIALPRLRKGWSPVARAWGGLPRLRTEDVEAPPSTARVILSYTLSLGSVFLLLFLLQVTAISQFQHFTSQNSLYPQLRLQMAEGSVPIGQTDFDGHLVESGAPLALISIPQLGVSEVVVEGSASAQTATGIGHRRDTPLPGQRGVSVLMGRSAAYGGVFKGIDTLRPGSSISIATGQGIATYSVIGVRTNSTVLPILGTDDGRLTLATASGTPFMPGGVTRVDAQLISKPFPRPSAVIGLGNITPSEAVLAPDTSGLFQLSWLFELLAVLVVAATWAWKRWDKRTVWLIFAPVLICAEFAVAGQLSFLLPNLL